MDIDYIWILGLKLGIIFEIDSYEKVNIFKLGIFLVSSILEEVS